MGLFDKKNGEAAKAELEKEIRQLEQEQEIEAASQQAFIVMSNINFAESLKLIDAKDANQYRVRTQQLFNEREAQKTAEKQRVKRQLTKEQQEHEEKASHMGEYREKINDARRDDMQASQQNEENSSHEEEIVIAH